MANFVKVGRKHINLDNIAYVNGNAQNLEGYPCVKVWFIGSEDGFQIRLYDKEAADFLAAIEQPVMMMAEAA